MPQNRHSSNRKGSSKKSDSNKIYADPLPVAFPKLPLYSRRILGSLGLSNILLDRPQCTGLFHPETMSVWITDSRDSSILWRRGFFGKGSLSRSEPTWFTRQKEGKSKTAEEITAMRREARKAFKVERAKAIEEAAEQAEAAFVAGQDTSAVAATVPSRPDEAELFSAIVISKDTSDRKEHGEDEDDSETENMEHLQLSLQEAFFLLWSMDCLAVLDNLSLEPLTLRQIWTQFMTAAALSGSSGSPVMRPDNPFLINYVVYHHFRSLGWVVRGGLKFCVDYLLYKRGPVFSHAEFAIVVCPTYENPEDQTEARHQLPNSRPFKWSWLSTLNRVNTQVQKSLILVYVTIPSADSLGPAEIQSPACLSRFQIREVPVRRFIPARMRD